MTTETPIINRVRVTLSREDAYLADNRPLLTELVSAQLGQQVEISSIVSGESSLVTQNMTHKSFAIRRSLPNRAVIAIDFNSLLRNTLISATGSAGPAVTRYVGTAVSASLVGLSVLGMPIAVRLMKGGAGQLIEAARKKDFEGAFLSGTLAALGTSYLGVTSAAGILGGADLLQKAAHIASPAPLIAHATQVLQAGALGLYGLTGLYGAVKIGSDLLFRYRLQQALDTEGRKAALEFLRNTPHLERRTGGLTAAELKAIDLIQTQAQVDALIDLALRQNGQQIIQDLLLMLIGALGIAAHFVKAQGASAAIYAVTAVLFVVSLDDPRSIHRFTGLIYDLLDREKARQQVEGAGDPNSPPASTLFDPDENDERPLIGFRD